MDSDTDTSEAGDITPASQVENSDSRSWLGKTAKKWSARAYAAVVWTCIYRWIFGSIPLPRATGKLDEVIGSLSLTLALSLVGIALCIAAVRGPVGFMQSALYTFLFPLLVPWLLLKFLIGVLWPPIRLIVSTFGSISRKRRWLWLSALIVAAVPYLCFLIVFGSRPWVIRTAFLLLLSCTAALIVTMFAWALAPVRIILGIGDRAIRWIVRRLGDVYFQHIPKSGPLTPKIEGKIISSVDFAGKVRANLESTAGFLLRPATAVLAFLIALVGLFSVVVISFGFQYLALARLDPQTFSGTPTPSAWQTVFFSVTTLATVGTSELRPATVPSQALVSVELLFGLVVVSLLALSFSTLHSTDSKAARVIWEDLHSYINSRFKLWAIMLEYIKRLFAGGFGDLLQEQFAQAEGSSAVERWLVVLRDANDGLTQAMPAIEAMLAQSRDSDLNDATNANREPFLR